MMQPAIKLLLDELQQLRQALAGLCRDGDRAVAAAEQFVLGDIGLVIALDDRRAGLAELADEPLCDLDMVVPVGVGCIDDVQDEICILQLFQRRLERLDEVVRQLGNESDRVGQDRLTRIRDGQLPNRRLFAGMPAPVRALSSVDFPAFV